MTPLQKKLSDLDAERSKARQFGAEFAQMAEPNDEARAKYAEIEKRAPVLEEQYRAAKQAVEAEESAETVEVADAGADVAHMESRERRELRRKTTFGEYLQAWAQRRVPAGKAADYSAACGVGPHEIPFSLFEPEIRAEQTGDPESRAITPAPSTVGINLMPIQPALFSRSVLPRVGVAMPMVQTGSAGVSYIATSQTAGPVPKEGATAATAGAITVDTQTPRRIQGRLSITAEDVASIGIANFESALRNDLYMALADAIDSQGLNGSGTGANVKGLLHDDNIGGFVGTLPSTEATWSDYAELVSDRTGIDGLWAEGPGDQRFVFNPETANHCWKTYKDDTSATPQWANETSAWSYLKMHTGGMWANKRMPAAASNVSTILRYRNRAMAMGGDAPSVVAEWFTWGSFTIDDWYSDAQSGVRHINAAVLMGSKVSVIYSGAFQKLRLKTST